jgi:hypothetical protein
MKQIIRLKESDLKNIIRRILSEQSKENINPNNLKVGDGSRRNPKKNNLVKQLQQKLMDLGFLKTTSMKPTGYFGSMTKNALDRYNGDTPKSTIQPTVPSTGVKPSQTSKVYLLFNGNTLSWVENGKTIKTWKSVSGRTKFNTFGDKNAEEAVKKYGVNYAEFMKVKEQGPIPVGNYTVSQVQKRTNGNATQLIQSKNQKQQYELMMTSNNHDWNSGIAADLIAWGDYRIPITKTGETETFGRGSFYIHGGGIPGSIGCIDLTTDMNDFAQYFMSWKDKIKNKTMTLVVKY